MTMAARRAEAGAKQPYKMSFTSPPYRVTPEGAWCGRDRVAGAKAGRAGRGDRLNESL